jgi:hypothetical protein
VSPRFTAISISEIELDSRVAPGPKTPPDSSRTTCSFVPAEPLIVIEFVLVVVAPEQGAGVSPNQSSPPTTTSVALDPDSTVAVTFFVVWSYEHDSASARPPGTKTAARAAHPASATNAQKALVFLRRRRICDHPPPQSLVVSL